LANEQWNLQTQYEEFSTRFQSGRVINTGNPQTISAFPVRDNCVTTHIPWISDSLELYRVHQAIAAAKGDGTPPVLRLDTQFRGDVAAYGSAVMREELEAASEAGYLRLTGDGGHFRPTLKGAYLMTWKQLPPFKGLYVRSRLRRVRRFLNELGIESHERIKT
jgi:hypothetical protein